MVTAQLMFHVKRTSRWCPWRESNPHLILRTDLLYPLSYKGKIPSEEQNVLFFRGMSP